jgi:hypothetical protein
MGAAASESAHCLSHCAHTHLHHTLNYCYVQKGAHKGLTAYPLVRDLTAHVKPSRVE